MFSIGPQSKMSVSSDTGLSMQISARNSSILNRQEMRLSSGTEFIASASV